MIRKLSLGLIVAAPLVLALHPVLAADAPKEISTAATHAGLAAGSTDLKMVRTHLHHVVNCLVGPSGSGFDGSVGNPCKDQGDGAIMDAPADKQAVLTSALTKATAMLGSTDLAAAKAGAAELQTDLKKAM